MQAELSSIKIGLEIPAKVYEYPICYRSVWDFSCHRLGIGLWVFKTQATSTSQDRALSDSDGLDPKAHFNTAFSVLHYSEGFPEG